MSVVFLCHENVLCLCVHVSIVCICMCHRNVCVFRVEHWDNECVCVWALVCMCH
ncbi:unnamed protein product, partial [Brassica rapa subsp. narinosa]